MTHEADIERMTSDYELVQTRFGSEVLWRFEPKHRGRYMGYALLAGALLWTAAFVAGFEIWKWWHR